MRVPGLVALSVALWPAMAAADRALILANERYDAAAAISAADEALSATGPLRQAGFSVVQGADLTTAEMRRRLSGFLTADAGPERLVIVLTGHFAHGGAETWFLGTEVDAPDLATVGGAGIALSTVLEIAGAAPGGAAVLLGSEERRIALGAGLAAGIRVPDTVPQGVTLIAGDASAVAGVVAGDLMTPGRPLAEALAGRRNLSVSGFVSGLVPFLPGGASPAPADTGATERRTEQGFWEATAALDTAAAYQRYLERYPRGLHAAEARAALEAIRGEPERAARLAEEALALSRDDRREVQRALSLLEFDPRGIDGVFGPGTRAAVTAWQRRNGFEPTGFLNRDSLAQLRAQAERRAAELEAEAAARREEQERADRAFWAETGAAGDEAGLRAYLRRFPDGVYADLAEARLAEFEQARAETAAERDRAAWADAEADGRPAAYQAYLRGFPEGAFADAARDRIDALTRDPAEEAAARAEAALNLPVFTLQLIESRLQSMGLDPGPTDGVLDNRSRRALRRYQDARGMTVTGYLDQPTVVRLLADSLPGIGR
ncbi:MAG: peptidoglycan-binding protein [Rhodobacteraceae bacterium]|nr:peptidoglycan-binding protein [Paracoccaceae bacterium]